MCATLFMVNDEEVTTLNSIHHIGSISLYIFFSVEMEIELLRANQAFYW